jgi:hypothetical protein
VIRLADRRARRGLEVVLLDLGGSRTPAFKEVRMNNVVRNYT